jgi:hypothetical protein
MTGLEEEYFRSDWPVATSVAPDKAMTAVETTMSDILDITAYASDWISSTGFSFNLTSRLALSNSKASTTERTI